MTDSLQAVAAELRSLADESYGCLASTKCRMAADRIERLDAEMQAKFQRLRDHGVVQMETIDGLRPYYFEATDLRAQLAACEKALRNLLNSLSSSDDEGLMEHADAVRDARAVLDDRSGAGGSQTGKEKNEDWRRAHDAVSKVKCIAGDEFKDSFARLMASQAQIASLILEFSNR